MRDIWGDQRCRRRRTGHTRSRRSGRRGGMTRSCRRGFASGTGVRRAARLRRWSLHRGGIRRTAGGRRRGSWSNRRLAVHAYIAVLVASTTDAAPAALLLADTLARRALTAAVAAFKWFECDQAKTPRRVLAHIRGWWKNSGVMSVREQVGGASLCRRRYIRSG